LNYGWEIATCLEELLAGIGGYCRRFFALSMVAVAVSYE
jgi:hypothetical protein